MFPSISSSHLWSQFKKKPYFLVSYFYGINNQTCTLYNTYCPTIPFTKYSAGKIMFELCQALQHLHMKQLLHRNIKSDNILLTTPHTGFHPMLIDFGKSIEVSEATSKRKCLSAQNRMTIVKNTDTLLLKLFLASHHHLLLMHFHLV